ncbi:SDR family NAD(P)-dependent oxidoreductase, partial [Yoonia sp.]
MTRLLGKTALITGGARGIGRAFAQAYLQNGARVAIADIDRDLCQATATALGDQVLAVHMDVSDPASITQAVDQTIAAFGQIDILI